MEIAVTQFAPGSTGLLAPLNQWLQDPDVSEILINKPCEVFIERVGTMCCYEMPLLGSLYLKRLFTLIANENRQVLNEQSPILSGNLTCGSRIQLVIPPAAKHYTLSIRRQSITTRCLDEYTNTTFYQLAKPFTANITDENLLADGDQELLNLYYQQNWLEFIKLAIINKKNIVISGETSSGKTTFLNACCQQIPAHERLITLEDTYEVKLPHSNQVNLLAPKTTNNSIAVLTMQDLVQCSLRLRPDRLIMGEIRGREIIDFVSACSTGHDGSLTTIHASNPRIAFRRMIQLYKQNNVPSMSDNDIYQELNAVIDIIIQLKKTELGRIITWVYFKLADAKRG